MAAILGMELDKVNAVLRRRGARTRFAHPANINSAEQVVISGNTAAVERAAKFASERGAKRAVMLPVSAPFHCSLMKPAQDRLAADLPRYRSESRGPGGVQRRRCAGQRRRRWPRRAHSPGHRLGEMGAVHPPADRAGSGALRGSRPRQSPLRPDAPDRSHESMLECRGRGIAAEDAGATGATESLKHSNVQGRSARVTLSRFSMVGKGR